MREKKIFRLAAAMVLAAVLAVGSCMAADVPDVNRTGSISVSMTEQGKAVPGGTLTICQVAKAVSTDTGLAYQYVNGFESCGIALGDLSDTSLPGKLQAKMAKDAVTTKKTIDQAGTVRFDNLPVGLYLVMQDDAAKGYRAVQSFLVTVPMRSGNTWVYEVDASPKVEVTKPETPNTPTTPTKPTTPNKKPTTPKREGKLPQTGLLYAPIAGMAAGGMLLFAIGWKLYNGAEKPKEKTGRSHAS